MDDVSIPERCSRHDGAAPQRGRAVQMAAEVQQNRTRRLATAAVQAEHVDGSNILCCSLSSLRTNLADTLKKQISLPAVEL